MKVQLNWLKDYVDINVSAEELQKKLFSCGFEVEELTYLGSNVNNCVVCRIDKITKHPDADKLNVCIVDAGKYGSEIQIVTAATNIFEGARVPVALDGATVHSKDGAVKIKKGKLRGVESNGMFCSGEELGINNDYYEGAEVNGLLILADDTPLGEDVKKVVGIDDYIFDIAVTANRPDCQSVYGMAREVAAVLGKKSREPSVDYRTGKLATSDVISVEVKANELCPRYVGHLVENVKIEKSPLWLRRRLAKNGLRSINNIVDITNYVLLELGQPMHAFDLANLEDNKIIVRRAVSGEKIVTLDEKEFDLNGDNLVICDGKKPVALAGIMGGLNSEIKQDTKSIVFESAKFARDNVRRTARKLGQSSDSSSRFEKGIDAYTNGFAMNRALHLIYELNCGVIACSNIDVNSESSETKALYVPFEKLDALLGVSVPREEAVKILNNLYFDAKIDGEGIKLSIPLFREDVDGVADIAEELIRMYGYEHITPTFLPNAEITNGKLTQAQKDENKLKNILVEQNCNEIVNYAFISPKDYEMLNISENSELKKTIRLLNPIGEDLSVMRTFLAPSMVNTIVRNLRRCNDFGNLFELGNVYIPKQLPLTELPVENATLCIGAWGDGVDFYTVKGVLEAVADAFSLTFKYERGEREYLHKGKTAEISCEGAKIGYVGQLAPDICEALAIEKPVVIAEIDYAKLSRRFGKPFAFRPLPKFAPVKRDLALLSDEDITCAQIEEVIYGSCKAVSSVELFDVFRSEKLGANKKSMAFSITFAPTDKPFEQSNVDNFIAKILRQLNERLSISIR